MIESGQVEYEYEDVSVVGNAEDYYENTDYVEKEYVYEYEETHLSIKNVLIVLLSKIQLTQFKQHFT